LPDAALRHTCDENREPERAISLATSTIFSASTPHSVAAYSGVYSNVEDALAGLERRHRQEERLRWFELPFPIGLIRVGRAVPTVALDASLEIRVHPRALRGMD
jgi:hypothetical protein